MKWRSMLVALLAALLVGCSGGAAQPPASGEAAGRTAGAATDHAAGKGTAPASPAAAPAVPVAPAAAAPAAPRPPVAAYPTSEFRTYAAKLALVATTPEARLALGYDATGKLCVWLSMQGRPPEYLQPGREDAALATVTQVFAAVPEVQGVWVAHNDASQTFAYFPRSVFDQKTLPAFAGDETIYYKRDWGALAEPYWKLDDRWGGRITDRWEETAIGHARTLFGSRFVSATTAPASMAETGLRIVVRGLPSGGDQAVRQEWARASAAISGRFLHDGHGYFLKSLTWVDANGKMLLQTSTFSGNYSTWWATGMRSGRMLVFGSPMDSSVDVNVMQDMEPNHTSGVDPWWETADSLQPVFSYLTSKVQGAQVLFAGRQDGQVVAALSLDMPETASQADVWKAQRDAALTAMAAPIHEVWVIVKQGKPMSAAFLDRMAYDAVQYPDPLLPPVTPELWPYAAAIYAEEPAW